jgi:hypothetical protein
VRGDDSRQRHHRDETAEKRRPHHEARQRQPSCESEERQQRRNEPRNRADIECPEHRGHDDGERQDAARSGGRAKGARDEQREKRQQRGGDHLLDRSPERIAVEKGRLGGDEDGERPPAR